MTLSVAVLVASFAASAVAATTEILSRSSIQAPDGGSPCGAAVSESTPQVAAQPSRRGRLVAVMLVDGGTLAAGARSRNGGGTWRSSPIPEATACGGGPEGRTFAVNPRVALGPNGVGYHGASFVGNDGPLFDFGVEVMSQLGPKAPWEAGAMPDGPAQDLVVLPSASQAGEARLLWTAYEQIPNPVTYLEAGTSLRTATSIDAGASAGESSLVYEPTADNALDDPKLLRTGDGNLVALVSQATYAQFLLFAAQNDSVRFEGVAVLSEDGGETWQAPVPTGDPILFTYQDPDTGSELFIGIADAAGGPAGSASLVWAEPEERGRTALVVSRTEDGGATWSPGTPVLSSPGLLMKPAVAINRKGSEALFWYDSRRDEPGDGKLMIDAWGSIQGPGEARVRRVHLAGPFDLAPLLDPAEFDVDVDALGVTQDVVALRRGKFGFAFTVPGERSEGDVTDVQFVKLGRTRG